MDPNKPINWKHMVEINGEYGCMGDLTTNGKEQGWTKIDLGSQSAIPTITGGIFEFGFSDSFQQMVGAFIKELSGDGSNHPFKNVIPEETLSSHESFTAALESYKRGEKIVLDI